MCKENKAFRFEIVENKNCSECFLYGAVFCTVKKLPACRKIMKELLGIDCMEKGVVFKKHISYETCTPENTFVGDEIYCKLGGQNCNGKRTVKYIFSKDSTRYGYAILRDETRYKPREIEEKLSNYDIEQTDYDTEPHAKKSSMVIVKH